MNNVAILLSFSTQLFPDAAARLKQQEEEEERIKWEGLGKRTRERPDYNEANMLKNVEGKANGGGGRKGRRGESDSEPDAGGIDDGSSGDEEGGAFFAFCFAVCPVLYHL